MSSRSSRPTTLTVAAAIQGVESMMLLAASIYVLVSTFTSHPAEFAGAIAEGCLGLIIAAGLGVVALGLIRVSRWARTPAVMTQIFAGVFSWPMFQASRFELATPLLLLALVGLALLFTGPTIRALVGE